eukprot:9456002-Prorocentrum_lima.AAC.1
MQILGPTIWPTTGRTIPRHPTQNRQHRSPPSTPSGGGVRVGGSGGVKGLSLIHISEPTRLDVI